jgi:hypothetical protein
LWRLWVNSGFLEDGFRWLKAVDHEPLDVPAEDRVAALCGGTIVALLLSKPGASDLAERAVRVSGGEPSIPLTRAFAWRGITRAIRAAVERDVDLGAAARRDIEDAIDIAHTVGADAIELLHNKGNIDLILGDMQAAEDAFGVVADETEEPEYVVYRAAPAHMLGHHDLAIDAVRPILNNDSYYRQLATWPSYIVLGAVALAGAGKIEDARALLVGHIDEIRRSAVLGSLEEVVLAFAVIAYLTGDHERASRLLGWIGSRTLEIGRFMPSGTEPPLYVHYVGLVRRSLDADTARRCRSEGRALSEDEAVALALAEPSALSPTT